MSVLVPDGFGGWVSQASGGSPTYLSDLAVTEGATNVWFGPTDPYVDIVGALDLTGTSTKTLPPVDSLRTYFIRPAATAGGAGETTGAGTIAVSRDTDRAFEVLFYYNTLAPGTTALFMPGTFNSAESMGALFFSSGSLQWFDPAWGTGVAIDTIANLNATWVYLNVNYDFSTAQFDIYYATESIAETSRTLALANSGTGALAQLWIGGNGTNIYTPNSVIYGHAAWFNQIVSSGHRTSVYSALGW